MLQRLTGDDRKTRFFVRDSSGAEIVEIVCGTVDRFQGREADMVLLSMRNTRRIGFLNSPNRLNVAVTRARQQLVVIGDGKFFKHCDVSELEELASRTRWQIFQAQRQQRRGKP
jgi:superfamily I DNA and/or RNA helicase